MKPLCCSKPVLLFSFLLFCLPSFAQLKADAGEDRVVCTYNYEKEYEIGGSPTASGGVGPYTYYWKGEGLVEPDNIWYLITNDLNDPANSNPKLIINNTWYSSFLFYLKVEDAAGNVAYDTVKIINANWRQLFYDSYDIVKRGDSIQLTGPFFDNDYLPRTYLITPSSGLTDSTNVYGWAKPDSSVTYYIQTENSYGCISPKVRYMNIKVVDSIMDSITKQR